MTPDPDKNKQQLCPHDVKLGTNPPQLHMGFITGWLAWQACEA